MNDKAVEASFPETRINCIANETSILGHAAIGNLYAGDVAAFLAGVNIVLASPDMRGLASKLISFLMSVVPELSRGVIFMSDDRGQLNPLATRINFSSGKRFSINKNMLKTVVRTQIAVNQIFTTTEDRRTGVIVLPFGSAHGRGVVHLEVDGAAIEGLPKLIELSSQIIGVISPKVESFQLQSKIAMLVTGALSTINAVIEAKDTYTSGHSQRVATYSQAIGEELRLSTIERDNLLISAICHDIGKVGVPDAILKKPGLLSAEEFEEMKAHPLIGAAIVESSERYNEIIGGIKYHHERFDGTGYPNQLAGEKIPLFGRIIAVADALDAMTSGRSYSGYMSVEEAVLELSAKTDLFDPVMLKALVKAQEAGKISHRTGTTISMMP